jgi:GrpB-like predicted nucleotidyltransferase (UPF0157 family)
LPLNNLPAEELGKLFPVIISEYNPSWNDLFMEEREAIPKPENPPPHMMFAKGYSEEGFAGQAFHIHARYKGDWDESRFRDYLISHPETAVEYAGLKLKLAELYPNDREKYTESKTEFIAKINALAKEENISGKNIT